MSYPGPAVTVHRAAGPPDLAGPPTVRFVAPGSVTAVLFGLFAYRMAARGAGHVHRTFSESLHVFYARHDQVNL